MKREHCQSYVPTCNQVVDISLQYIQDSTLIDLLIRYYVTIRDVHQWNDPLIWDQIVDISHKQPFCLPNARLPIRIVWEHRCIKAQIFNVN